MNILGGIFMAIRCPPNTLRKIGLFSKLNYNLKLELKFHTLFKKNRFRFSR
jgi:hypothetical protein